MNPANVAFGDELVDAPSPCHGFDLLRFRHFEHIAATGFLRIRREPHS